MKSMTLAWERTERDYILEILPLHHVHGVVNILLNSLYVGGTCHMLEKFDSEEVWEQLLENERLNLFMAVPTVYSKLISAYNKFDAVKRQKVKDVLQKKIRVFISGSMALPDSTMRQWHEISGHVLLERYGMSEIGMALGSPLRGERRFGFVGRPFPGVNAKIVNVNGKKAASSDGAPSFEQTIVEPANSEEGELLIKSPQVFEEYWGKMQETVKAFDQDGWFKTGDIAREKNSLLNVFLVLMFFMLEEVVDGYFKILGRSSVDILKSAGFKISALDIERVMLEHPSVSEVAVVGIPDPQYEQVIGAIVVSKGEFEEEKWREWMKERIAHYKIPRKVLVVKEMPRNAMGKTNKKELVKLFQN